MKDRFGLTLLLDADGRARIRGSAWHCSPENKKLLCYYAASQRFEHFYGISESRFSEIFFLAHHNDENIMKDILAGIVFLILNGEEVSFLHE